jgi:SAM-dependent methyltransferase
MGNEIYKEQNRHEFPEKVKERIETFIRYFKKYSTAGTTADVCCGNKWIGKRVGATAFFDFFQVDDEVRFIDCRNEDYSGEKFDNIIISHALEHFENPVSVLRKLGKMMNPGGRCFIAVPNSLYGDAVNEYKPFSKEIGHVSTFTAQTLSDTIAKSGCFRTEEVLEIKHPGAFEIYARIRHD